MGFGRSRHAAAKIYHGCIGEFSLQLGPFSVKFGVREGGGGVVVQPRSPSLPSEIASKRDGVSRRSGGPMDIRAAWADTRVGAAEAYGKLF